MRTYYKIILTIFLYSGICYSQSGWSSLNLNPVSAGFSSIYSIQPSASLAFSSYSDGWTYNFFKVYRTINAGITWDTICVYNGRILLTVQFTDNMTGYAGGGWNIRSGLEDDNGLTIFKTTNGGISWNVVYEIGGTPFPYQPITDLYFLNSNTGWACGLNGQIIRTTNGGINFTGSAFSPAYKKYGIHFRDLQNGLTIGDSGYISYTTNSGMNWITPARLFTANLRSVYFINQNTGWIAGYGGTILKTTNGGTNWILINTGTTNNLLSIYFYNTEKGWTAGNNIVLATTNGGDNWTAQPINPSSQINTISFSDSLSGWICGANKVYKTITGGWTAITNTAKEIPEKYELFQNYPNPFNLTTKISFNIPAVGDPDKSGFRKERSTLVLKVFDMLGREVATLVNEQLEPGTYTVDWNAGEYSSGVYFYRLTVRHGVLPGGFTRSSTGDFSETKKLILLK